MRKIKHIVIHCADTPKGMDIGVKEIREWHTKERGWSDIGYHYVIKLDGTIQLGRPLEKIGAHVKGYNSHSIGICYIGGKGGDTRTDAQKATLESLLYELKDIYPDAEILGHRDFPGVTKSCPSFNAKEEYKDI